MVNPFQMLQPESRQFKKSSSSPSHRTRSITRAIEQPHLPIQCIKQTVSAPEWYDGWKVRQGANQKFIRANLRKAIIIPPKACYPHLTIDVDDVEYDHKKSSVTLTINRFHYSASLNGKRYYFQEARPSGNFVCIGSELPPLETMIRINRWLKASGLNIKLEDSPPSTPVAEEPLVSDKLEATATEATSKLTLEESSSDQELYREIITAVKRIHREKARLKQSRKQDAPIFIPGMSDKTEELQLLFEDMKFTNLKVLFDIDDYTNIPAMEKYFLSTLQSRFMEWHKERNLIPVKSRVDQGSQELKKELEHYKHIKKRTGKYHPKRWADFFHRKSSESVVPSIEQYSPEWFIPEDYVPDFEDKKNLEYFKLAIKVSYNLMVLQLSELRVQEMAEISAAIYAFIFRNGSRGGFFELLCKKHSDAIQKAWDAIPEEKMFSIGHKTFTITEVEDNYPSLEAYWDLQAKEFQLQFEVAQNHLRAWQSMPSDEEKSLDEKLDKLLSKLDASSIKIELLNHLIASSPSSKGGARATP